MKNKLLSLLTLTAYLTSSLTMPVFAGTKHDQIVIDETSVQKPGDIVIITNNDGNVNAEVFEDLLLPPQNNSGEGVVICNNNSDREVSFHSAGDITVNETGGIANPGAPFLYGLTALNRNGKGANFTVIDGNMNFRMPYHLGSDPKTSDRHVISAEAESGGTSQVIVRKDVFVTGNEGNTFDAKNMRGVKLRSAENGTAGAVVAGDVYVACDSSEGSYGVDIYTKNNGFSYAQIGKDVTVNGRYFVVQEDAGLPSTGVIVTTEASDESIPPADTETIDALREQDLIRDNASRVFGEDGMPVFKNSSYARIGGKIISMGQNEAHGAVIKASRGASAADIGENIIVNLYNGNGRADCEAYGVQLEVEKNGAASVSVGKDIFVDGYSKTEGLQMSFNDQAGTGTASVSRNIDVSVSSESEGAFVHGIDIRYDDRGKPQTSPYQALVEVGGRVTADKKGGFPAEAVGILVDGGNNAYEGSSVKIHVKGDVISSGEGIALKNLGKCHTDITIEGTIFGRDSTAVITNEGDGNEDLTVNVWKMENTLSENAFYDDSLAEHVQYIIKSDSDAVSFKANKDTPWNKTIDIPNKGKDDTVYCVANEGDSLLLDIDVPGGKEIKKVFADADKEKVVKANKDGEYWIEVKKGGGVLVSVEFKDKAADPVDPVDPEDPEDPEEHPKPETKPAREVKVMDLAGLTLEGKAPSITLYGPGKTISYNGRAHVWTEEKLTEKKKKKRVPDLDISVNGIPGSVSFDFAYGKNKDASENKGFFYLKLKPFKGSPSYNALDPKVRKNLKKEIKKINKALKNKKNRFYLSIKPLDLSGFTLDSEKSKGGSLEFYRKGLKSDTLTLTAKPGKKGGETVWDEKTVKKAALTGTIAGHTFKIPKKQYTVKATDGKVTVEGKGKNLTGTLNT